MKLGKKSIKDKRTLAIFIGILLIALFSPFSPIFSVVLAGIAGYYLMPRTTK